MPTLKDRISIDWLREANASPDPKRGRDPDSYFDQALAGAVKKALASSPGNQNDVATLANLLQVKFSALLPVVERLAEQGAITVIRKDPKGGDHLVKL